MAKDKSNPVDPLFEIVKKDPSLIPMLATDDAHAERLRSQYDRFLANQKLQDSGFSAIGTESSFIGNVPTDLDSYERLGVDYKPRYVQQSQEERAGAQSNWEKLGRGLKRIIPDFLYQVAGSVGAIVDVEDYINSPEEEEIGNWLSDWASGQQEKLKQTDGFQIYNRANAGMGDIGWWIENGSSLVSSVAGFAVPGMALGKVFNGIRWLDRLTKLAKGGTAISEGGAVAAEAINVGGKGLTWLDRMLDGSNLTRITQGRNVANNLAANLALNQAEGLMEATSVYKDTYDDALTRGVDEESAKRMAGTAAAYTINTNRMNMALNATSVGRFLKSPDAIKSAVKLRSWRVKDILKSPEGVESVWKDALVKEGLQEAGEELVNYYAGEKGRGVLDRILLSGENVNVNENLFNPAKIPDILAGLGTKEGFESAALGFLGGAGQTVLTESFDFIPGKITGERVIKTDEKGRPIYKYKDVSYNEATPYERGERVWDEIKLSDGRVLKDGNEYTVQKDAEGNETLALSTENYKVTDDDIINNSEILIHKPTELVRNAEGEVIKQNTGEVEYEADGKYFSKVQARKKQWESSQKLNEVVKTTTDKLMNSAQTAQRQAQDWTLIEAVDMLNDPNTNNDQRNTYKDLITRYELFREGKLTGDEVLDKKAIEEKRKEVDNMSTVDLVSKQNQARESLISELAWNSFSTNSTETLLDTFNNIANMSPEKAAEQGYSEDYREKATKSINDINKLKNIFVEYNSKYDPQTAKALFDNRAMDMFLYRDRDRLTSEQNTMVRDVSKKAQERSDRLNTIEGLDQARAINQEEDKELQPHRERLNALNDKIAEIRSRKTQIAGDSMDPMDLINSIERNEEAKRKEINEILAEKDKELAKVRDIRDKYNFKRREYDLLDNADIENIGRYDLLLQRQRERITNNDQLFIELRDRIRVNKVKQQAINFQRLKELRFIDFMETILSLQAKGTHSPVFRVDETFTEEDEHAKVLFSMLYERYKLLVESKKTTPGEINVLSDNPPITSATERSTKLQEARDANNATLVASLERQYNLEDILYQKETTLSSQIAARMALGDDSITYSENLINEVKDAIKNLVQDKKQPRTELEKKVQSLYNNSVKEDDQAVGSRPEKTTPTSPIKDFEKDIEEIIQQYTKLFNEFMTERFNSMKPRVISKLKNKLKRSQKLSETQLFIEELLTSGLNGKISKEEQDGKTTYYFIPELQSGMYIDESEKNFYEFATYPESKDKIYDVKATDTPGYYTVTVKDPEYKVQMTVDNSKQIEVYSKEQIEYKDNLENALKVIRNQANRLKQLRREKSKALADVNDSSNSILVGLNNLKELFEQRIPGFKEFISALERGDVDPEEKAEIREIELAEKRAEIESRREEELERLRTDPSYEDEGGPEALDGYLFSESGLSFEDYRSIRINARYDAELDMVGTESEEALEKKEPSGLYSDILKFFDVLPKSIIDAKKTYLETQLNDLNLAKNVLDLELQNNAEKVRNLINDKKKVEDALNAGDKVKLKTALVQQLEEIQKTMSSIKATNISLKKKKSRIVSKINETDKALKNYKILSELALNNKLTVSELRADLKNYNNDLLKTKEALVNSIDKNEQLLAELKELRKFYNSFIKEKTGDLDKINQALDSQTEELAKLGYELDDDTAKRIKRDYYLDSAYKSFYEEFQMLLNSKRLTKSQYNSTISRIADVIDQLETHGDEDDQLINHFRRLHVKLTEIASKPDSKIRTKFTKEFKALFPKYKDGEFKKMVAESISYFQESVDKIYVADAVLENISKLNTAKNNVIGSVNEIKDLVVYKANGLVTPDLELGKVTSVTKLNKIISSLSKKLSEQSAEHKILTDKYSAISKDVDAFFNTYVYKDMLEYRKSLKSSINTFKKEIEKTSGAIIDSLVTTKQSKRELINKIAKDSTDLSNPLNLLEEMLTYLNSVDKFIVTDDEVESNENTLTDELAESNRSINLRISKTSQTISDSFDSVTNSLKSIEQTSAQLQKELAAIESLPKPDLQDLWELRKASGDVNPTETDVYFAQIQSLSESIEKTKEYIANNSSALQSWMSFLRLIPSEKTKPGVEKYLSALEERLLEQFGLAESFEESDFDNIVEYINDVFAKMIGLSPELLNYDKILKGDFSELTEQLDTDFSERLNTIPKLELELKLLKEAYGDIEQIIKTEKDTQAKTGKKEIAELTQKFNTTHAPIQGEPAVIEDNFENLNTDLSNLIIEQNLKPVGALITSAYDVEYKLEDSEAFGIKVKTPVTVFDKEGLPKFTKNRQQRYWSILLNKIAAGSFTDEEGKPFPNPNQLRLRFVLADDKFIKDEFAHSDDVNPSQKEELFKRGLSVDETGKVFIFNRAALAKFAGAYGSYFDAAGATVDLISDSDKALMKSLLEKENGTVDNDKSRLTVQEFDLLFKYRIADTYSKKQGDELVLHFTDEKYENSTFIYGTGMYVTITDAKGTEYYFDLANNKFTTDKAKLKTGDYDKIVTTLVRPSSVKRMQLKNSLATYIYGETFGSPTPISWIDLNKVLSDANIKTVNVKHNGQNYAVSLEEIANLPDSFVIAKEKYDQLSDIQKILFEISEKFVVDNISNEFDGRRSIKQLLRANPDKIFVSKSPIKISQGIPLETQDDTFKNITGKPNSAVTSAEDIEAYLVHTLGNKSQVSSWGESIDALFSGDATIKAGKGKRGRVYLKKKNKTVIEGITRKLNDNEAQLIIDMFATDYSGFVDQDADGPRTMRQIEDESGNKVPGIDAAYLTMWPGNEFAKSMIQKLIFFQRKANDTKKPNAGTFIIDLDNRPEFGNSRKLYIYYGVDGKIALSDLKNPDRNKEAVDKFKDWLKTRPLNLLNNIPQDKPYYHPVAIKKSKSGDPVLVVKKFEPTSDKNKVHPYVSYMFSESNGQTVLQTKIVPDESFYDTQEKLKGKGQQVSNRYVIVENGAISTESAIVADGKIASITPTITPGTGAAPTGVVENTNPNFTKVEEIERTEDLANQKVQIKKKYTVSNDVLFKDMDPNKTYRIVAKDLADDSSDVITEFDVTFKNGFPDIVNIIKSEKIVNGKPNDITINVKKAIDDNNTLSIFLVGVFNEIKDVKNAVSLSDSNFNNIFSLNIGPGNNLIDLLKNTITNKSSFKIIDTNSYLSKTSYEVSYEETVVENLPLTDLQKDQILTKEFEKILFEMTSDDPLTLSKTIEELKELSAKALTKELKDDINKIIESLNVPKPEIKETKASNALTQQAIVSLTDVSESKVPSIITELSPVTSVTNDIEEDRQAELKEKGFTKEGEPSLEYEIAETEADIRKIEEGLKRREGENNEKLKKRLLAHKRYLGYLRENKTFDAAFDALQKDYEDNLPIVDETIPGSLEFAKNYSEEHQTVVELFKDRYKERNEIRDKYDARIKESKEKSTSVTPDKSVTFTSGSLADFLQHTGLRIQLEPLLAKIYTSWDTIPVTVDNKLDISAEASEQLSADRKEFKRSIIIGNKFTPEDKKQSSRKIIHEVVHTVTLVKLNSYYRDPSKVSDKIREGVEALIQVRNDYLKALAANPKKIEDNSRVTYLFNYLPSEFGLNNKQYFKAIREALMQWSALYDTDPNTSIDILYDKIIERLKAASPSVSEDVVKKYKESLTNNVTEFISGIFENKDLREDLSKITSPRSGNLVDLLTDLVNALKTYFLSIGDSLNSQEESLLNEAINAAETIIKSDLYKLSDKKTIDPSPEVDTKITGGITPDAFNTLDDEGGNAYYPEDVNITSSEDFDSDLLDLFDLVYSDNYKDNQDLLDEHFNLIKSMFNISNDALYNAKQNLNYFNDSERTSSSDTDVINKLFSLLDSVPVVRNATNGITSVFKLLDEFDAFKDLSIKDKSLLLSERIKEYITFGNSEDLKSVDSLFQDDSPLIEMFRQIKQMNDLFELNNNLVRETYKTLQIPLPTTVKTNIMKYFTPTFVDKNGEEIEDFPDIFTTELLDALDYFVLKGILSDTNLSSTLDLSLSNANIGTIYSEAFKNITAIFDRNIKNILNANNINLADRLNNIQQVKDVIGIYENRSSLIASHMSTRMSQLFPKLDINEMDINDIADLDEYATKENLYEDSDLRDVSQSISGVMKMLLSSVPKKKKLTNKVSLTPEKEKEYTTILNELKKFRESAVLKNLENVDGVSKRFIMNKKGFEGFTVIGSPHKLIKTLIEFIPKNEIETLEILNTLLSSKYNVDEQKGLSRDKNLQVLISSTLDKAINKLDLLISNKIASLSILDDNSLLLSLPQLEDFGRVWNYIARRSSGLPNDYDVFFNSRLNQIVNDEFNKDSRGLYGLTDIQKYISEFADLSDPYNLAIRATASQAFNKYEMINYIITADSTGLISLVDANINRESKDIRSAWESNYLERLRNFNVNITKSISSATNDISDLHDIYERKSYADLIISPFYIQRLKDLVKAAQASKSDTTKAAEYLDEVLSLLGINMSNSARMYSSYKNNSVAGISYGAFMNRLSSFIIALDEAAKVIDPLNPIEDEDNVHQRKFVNIFSNSATAGFINELITYQLNEQNEFITNQFQNAEGKTVYALQLMHSLTNTASTLNYYNSSEETLRENLPHLFNRMSGYVENGKFVSTSLLLSGVLSDAKKNVNIVSLNGARDSDNNSKITATLSPGELLATRIKHITSGVYLINQAADRKVTNGIVMSNNNKNEVFFQNISDGLEQFRKYLLNEMNAMLNDAGDDIIFFKDKRHEFRYFKGILGKVATKAAKELISLKQRNEFITFDELNSYEYTDAETGTVYKLRDLVDESVSKFFSKEVDKLFKQGSKTGIFNSTTTKIVWEKGEAKREHIGKIKKIKTTKNPNGTISFAREKGADQQYHNVEEVVNTFNFPIGIGYELWREYQGKKYWLLDQNKTGDSWDDTIKQILTSVVFNQAAAYVEQSIVFTGDPAIYKNLNDMYKRIAMHNSPKKTIIIGKMVNEALKNNKALVLYKESEDALSSDEVVRELTDDEVKNYIKGKYKVPKDHYLKAESGFRVDRYFSDFIYNPDLIKTVITDDVFAVSDLAFDKVSSIEVVNKKPVYKDADGKKLELNQVSTYRKVFTDMFLNLGITDERELMNKVEAYLDPYLKIEESNAIGLITLSEYRNMFIRSGLDWTKKHELAFVKAISGEVLSSDDMQLFQPIKSQYSGPLHDYLNTEDKTVNGDSRRLNVHTGYKHMLMPLIPSAIKGTYYEKVSNYMNESGVGILQFISGNKYGTKMRIDADSRAHLNEFIPESESKIKSNFESWVDQSIYYKYFGIQVDNKPKLKGEQRVSTQGRKTMTLNSKEFGVAVDPALERLVDSYTDVNNTLTFNNWDDFKKKLGVYFDSKTNSSVISDIEYLIKILLDQEKDRGSNMNTVSSIVAMLENPNMKIENTMSPGKVQNVLMALVRNRVLKDKRKGESFAQVPVSGFDKIFRNRHETGKMNSSKELLFYRQGKDGSTLPAQAMVPYPTDWTPWLLKMGNGDLGKGLDELNKLLDKLHTKLYNIRETDGGETSDLADIDNFVLTAEEENLLNLTTIIGFRIPNQGFSSNEVFEIRKFLPAEHGALVVLPTEIVAKNGSDFDFDKNNTYIPNWRIDKKTGIPTYINPDNFDKAAYGRYISKIKKELSKSDEFVKGRIKDIKQVNSKIKEYFSSQRSILTFANLVESSPELAVYLEIVKASIDILTDAKSNLDTDQIADELEVFTAVMDLIDQFKDVEGLDLSDVASVDLMSDLRSIVTDLTLLVNVTKPELISDFNTYIEANSLPFEEYKRNFKENPLKYSDQQMLENRSIKLHKDILTHPANFGQLISPIDDSVLKGKKLGPKKDYNPGIVWKVRFFKSFNNPDYSKIVEEYKAELASGENRKTSLDKAVDKFINIYSELEDQNASLSGALLISQNLDKFNAFLVGKRNIGAVARHITSLSNAQRSNLFINTPIIVNVTDGKPNVFDNANIYFEGNWVVDVNNSGNVVELKENPYEILKPENEVYESGVFKGYKDSSGEIVIKDQSRIYPSLGGIKTKSNERISDVLSALLTSFVDVAKDPYIFDMNGTTATVHTWGTMLRAGASLEYTALFINQPIVSTYLEKQAANETLLTKIHDLDTTKEVIFISSLAEHSSEYKKLISTKDWYKMSITEREDAYLDITGGVRGKRNKLTKGNQGKYTTKYWKSVAVNWEKDEKSPIDKVKEKAFWDDYEVYMTAYRNYAKQKNTSLYKLKNYAIAEIKKQTWDYESRTEGIGKTSLESLHNKTVFTDYNEEEGYTMAHNANIYKQLFLEGKLSVEALEDYMSIGIPEREKAMITFAILDLFAEYQRNGVELNRGMNAVSFDTFGTPKSILGLYNYNMSHTRASNLEYFGNFDDMTDKTIIKPFKQIFAESEELFSKMLFVQKNTNFWQGIKELADRVNIQVPYDEHENKFVEIVYEFQNFLLHFDFEDGLGKAVDTKKIYRELILGFKKTNQDLDDLSDTIVTPKGNKSLPRLINEIKTKPSSDPWDEILKKNAFINALSIRDVTNISGPEDFFNRTEADTSRFTNPVLMIFTRKMTPNDVNDLILGFRQIRSITKALPKGHKFKNLYNDLIDFCLACYGVDPNANNSYYQFIPPESMIEKMSLTIERFNTYTAGHSYVPTDVERSRDFSNPLNMLMGEFHDQFWRRYSDLPKIPKKRMVFDEYDGESYTYEERSASAYMARNFAIPYAVSWKVAKDGTPFKTIVEGRMDYDSKGNLKRVFDNYEGVQMIGSKSWVGYNPDDNVEDALIIDQDEINQEEQMLITENANLLRQLNTFNYRDPNEITSVTSGLADGTDKFFVGEVRVRGVNPLVIKEYTTSDYDNATPEAKKEMDDKYGLAVNALHRIFLSVNAPGGKLVRRDWLQVKNAENIVAIGNIVKPGAKSDAWDKTNKKHYTNDSGKQAVDGGTGYAVEMAIQEKKPVYVFHLGTVIENSINMGWHQWDYDTNSFKKLSKEPELPNSFAAIGTRQLNENGKKAIRSLLNSALGEPRPGIINPNRTSEKQEIVSNQTSTGSKVKYVSLGSIALNIIKDKVFDGTATTSLRQRSYTLSFYKGDGYYDVQGDDSLQVKVKRLGEVTNNNETKEVTIRSITGIETTMSQDELAIKEGYKDWEDFTKNVHYQHVQNFITEGGSSTKLDMYSVLPLKISGIAEVPAVDGRVVYTGVFRNKEDVPENGVLVFGANGIGVQDANNSRGKSASVVAKLGLVNNGEIMIDKYSENGKSWGLYTVTRPGTKLSRTPDEIVRSIDLFYEEALRSPEKKFYVMYGGSDKSLNNGYAPLKFASFFNRKSIPSNVIFNDGFYDLMLKFRQNISELVSKQDADYIPTSQYDDGPFKSATHRDPSISKGYYEVTTKGDPRFSAMGALIEYTNKKGKKVVASLEELYQLNVKGYGEAQERDSTLNVIKHDLLQSNVQVNDLNIAAKLASEILKSVSAMTYNGEKIKGKSLSPEKFERLKKEGRVSSEIPIATSRQYLWDQYLGLWDKWVQQNPKLFNELAYTIYSSNYQLKLNDQYGFNKNNQARALTNLLNKYYGENKVFKVDTIVKVKSLKNKFKIHDVKIDKETGLVLYGLVPDTKKVTSVDKIVYYTADVIRDINGNNIDPSNLEDQC